MDKRAELQRILDDEKQKKQESKQWDRIEASRKKIGLDETIVQLGLEGRWLEGAKKRQKIDGQWDMAKPMRWRNNHSGEHGMLYDLLEDDEVLECLVGGTFRADTDRLHKHKGIAAATSKRVIFLDKGILGSTEVMEMPYRNVEAITYSTGMMFGGIQVTGRGMASFRIEDIAEKDSLQPFADCVRAHAETDAQPLRHSTPEPAQPAPAAPTAMNAIDELERLAELAERGILTQEEFTAKKKQLLGI